VRRTAAGGRIVRTGQALAQCLPGSGADDGAQAQPRFKGGGRKLPGITKNY